MGVVVSSSTPDDFDYALALFCLLFFVEALNDLNSQLCMKKVD